MAIAEKDFKILLERTSSEDLGLDILLKDQHVSSQRWHETLAAESQKAQDYAAAKQRQILRKIDSIAALEEEAQLAIQACDPKIANAMASVYKMRIDNLKWLASKLEPKIYGDKLAVETDNTLNICISNANGKRIDV